MTNDVLAARFLNILYPDKEKRDRILIWTLKDRKSHWFTDIQEASRHAVVQASETDVYFGVGLTDQVLENHQRAKSDQITAIPGAWADIDVVHPLRKKKNLPETKDEAIAFLDGFKFKPSLTIDSGYGIQAYWLFKEIHRINTEDEREHTNHVLLRWHQTLLLDTKEKGWSLDSVHDLSRVMRIPGTWNRKGTVKPIPVKIISESDFRCELEDLEGRSIEYALPSKADDKFKAIDIALSQDANPPFEKFAVLSENEPKFNMSWNRKRKDLRDNSPSGYDMSLAAFACRAGWYDQEIVDLLIASRRKHGDDLKFKNPDYYKRTVYWARENTPVIFNESEIIKIYDNNKSEDKEKKEQLLEYLSNVLTVKIKKIVKYRVAGFDPTFHLLTPTEDILVGDIKNLMSQALFRNKIAAVASRRIPDFKSQEWAKITQTLLSACEVEDTGQEMTREGTAANWIESYLEDRPPLPDQEEAVKTRYPFLKDTDVFIFASDLQRWIAMTQSERVTSKHLGVILRSYGCTPEMVTVKQDDRITTRSVWRIK